MGNIYGYQREDRISNRRIPSPDAWLQNQKFRIQGEFYTLSDRRGGGAFGSVWASTTADGRRAAVKVFDLRRMRSDISPSMLANSFKEEVKMSYKLRDAKYHVANIYGFDFDAERRVALMAMELGDDTLEDRAKDLNMRQSRHPPMGMTNHFIPPKDRKNIWAQMVQIILVLDQHNIVHCDIKPANLVFFGPTLKIVDLGIAQKAIAGHNPHRLGGSPFYSAPECFEDVFRITSKADIWSLGAILYYLTYGFAPQFLSSQPPPGHLPTRSSLVQDVLHHSLQVNPHKRASHQWFAQHPLAVGPLLG